MHELSLAASIVEIALRHASGQRVTRVHVKVGYLRQVVPSALAFSFDLVAQDTLAEGATLELEAVPAIGACRHCGTESQLHAFPLQCPACSSFDVQMTAGEELIVESLELEEVGGAALSH